MSAQQSFRSRVSQEFLIRQATHDDVAVIGWHRARMFQDMSLVPDELFESSRKKAHRHEGGRITIAESRQGLIVNVFNEPDWRRRGIAKLLMKEIIAWSREQTLDDLVLHASDGGRRLYEQLGFVLTNEMRLRGDRWPS
jgi:GNAT superfamily N-acetyltransferase